MTQVWLKYRQQGAALGTTTAMRIPMLFVRPDDEVDRIDDKDLNGRLYQHTRSSRDVWDLVIGADQLVDSTIQAFVDEFWIGAQHWLSLDQSATEPAAGLFSEISIPSGRSPKQALEQNWGLVSFEFTATSKVPH